MKYLLSILAMSFAACSHSGEMMATAEVDEACVADRARLMALDYQAFDQGADGIRSVLGKTECQLAAANLYREYHAAQRARGVPVMYVLPDGAEVPMSETGEMSILYWHEGQLRAFAGDTEGAIAVFERSLATPDPSYYGWDEYVRGTIAFLRDDLVALTAEREAMSGKVSAGYGDINLGVLDGLIVCFGRSYSDAYGAPECNRRPSALSP